MLLPYLISEFSSAQQKHDGWTGPEIHIVSGKLSNLFFPLLSHSFIEDFFQKPGVTLTEEQKRIYKEDLYMSNLPEKDVYLSQLKAAGFTDIQVCKIFNASCF